MKLIVEKSKQKMSESAMMILLGAMMQDKQVNVSLTAGRTPDLMYQMMIPYVKNQKRFAGVHYYLFDENPYIDEHPGPNWNDMQRLFFKEANIEDERIFIPTEENYMYFDDMIKKDGGIDVMVIGLGWDGHFCGNCPRCTPFDSLTYKLDFSIKRAANPTYAPRPRQPFTLTMGPQSLMRVKHLVMIVDGKEKAEIFKRFLDEQVNEDVPATILKLHPNLTVIADKDAASLLDLTQYEHIM